MIIQYNKIQPEHRTLIRSIESKSYSRYIRYLLLKKWPFPRIKKELMRLGFAWNEEEELKVYFSEVLYPLLKKYKLSKYYKRYKTDLVDDSLSFSSTFGTLENDRVSFVDFLHATEVVSFFADEIVAFYGGVLNIPSHPRTGKPLLEREKPVDLVDILQNPKRHVIEKSLIDGYSPAQISDHLFQMYDMEISARDIKVYAQSFFNVKRQDVQRLIDDLQAEKDALENRLIEIRHRPPDDFSVGERFEMMSAYKTKSKELDAAIKRLRGVHTNAAYNAAVLEMTDVREIFKDALGRTYRRFREMDERTEDDVVGPLSSLVNTMSKATEKIMAIEDILSQKTSKTIQEEILEAVIPTLDRIEQEEREAMYAYKQSFSKKGKEDEEEEILGFD